MALHLLISLSYILGLLSPTSNPFNGYIYFYLNVFLKNVYCCFVWYTFCLSEIALSCFFHKHHVFKINLSMSMFSPLLLPAAKCSACTCASSLTHSPRERAGFQLPAATELQQPGWAHRGRFPLGPGWEYLRTYQRVLTYLFWLSNIKSSLEEMLFSYFSFFVLVMSGFCYQLC